MLACLKGYVPHLEAAWPAWSCLKPEESILPKFTGLHGLEVGSLQLVTDICLIERRFPARIGQAIFYQAVRQNL